MTNTYEQPDFEKMQLQQEIAQLQAKLTAANATCLVRAERIEELKAQLDELRIDADSRIEVFSAQLFDANLTIDHHNRYIAELESKLQVKA